MQAQRPLEYQFAASAASLAECYFASRSRPPSTQATLPAASFGAQLVSSPVPRALRRGFLSVESALFHRPPRQGLARFQRQRHACNVCTVLVPCPPRDSAETPLLFNRFWFTFAILNDCRYLAWLLLPRGVNQKDLVSSYRRAMSSQAWNFGGKGILPRFIFTAGNILKLRLKAYNFGNK